MSSFTEYFIVMVETLSRQMPLGWFSFIGGFIEDLFAFVPSPLAMTTAGVLAYGQGHEVWVIFWLAALGAAGHLTGSLVLYILADKSEDLVFKKRKIFGFSHTDIEGFGRRLSGQKWKSGLVLFALRATPFTPSGTIAATCGVIKLGFTVFVPAIFLGAYTRNVLLLFLGFSGLEHYDAILQWVNAGGGIFLGVVTVALVGGLVFAYLRYKKRPSAF